MCGSATGGSTGLGGAEDPDESEAGSESALVLSSGIEDHVELCVWRVEEELGVEDPAPKDRENLEDDADNNVSLAHCLGEDLLLEVGVVRRGDTFGASI